MKQKLIALLIAFSTVTGVGLVSAPAANAWTKYYHGHNYCLYKGIYYVGYGVPSHNTPATEWYVHVDYNWTEEFYFGWRDYEYYSHRDIYPNGWCA